MRLGQWTSWKLKEVRDKREWKELPKSSGRRDKHVLILPSCRQLLTRSFLRADIPHILKARPWDRMHQRSAPPPLFSKSFNSFQISPSSLLFPSLIHSPDLIPRWLSKVYMRSCLGHLCLLESWADDLNFPSLSFLIYKMAIIIPTSWGLL